MRSKTPKKDNITSLQTTTRRDLFPIQQQDNQPIKINWKAQERAKQSRVRDLKRAFWSFPDFPPGVKPSGDMHQELVQQIAQDEAPFGLVGPPGNGGGPSLYGWAQNVAWSAFEEGVAFLGYPYLAQLMLRAEYRIMVETIAAEMTRKWIRFKSKGNNKKQDQKISDLDAVVKEKYFLPDVFYRAAVIDDAFGRSHIYCDTGDTDKREELIKPLGDIHNRDRRLTKLKLGKNQLKRFAVVEPVWSYPLGYNSSDPLAPNWYRPTQWFAMGKQLDISRFPTFVGHEVPDLLKPAFAFGGLALTQMAKPYVDNWLRTRQSVSDLIHSFSVFVLATNLSTLLQQDGDKLFERADFFNNTRDNRNLMMIDRDSEAFQNVSASIGGLHELQAQSQEHMFSVSRIPAVKFSGIQPTGLNASSEGEIRTFYDTIHAYQEHLFRINLTYCIDLVQLSEFGEIDEDIEYDFEPLWELDAAAEAAVQNQKANTHSLYLQEGVVSQEDVRRAVIADKDGPYAGLDLSEEPPLSPEQEEMFNEAGQEEGGEGGEHETGTTERMERQAEEFGSPETGGFKGDIGPVEFPFVPEVPEEELETTVPED